MKCAAPCPAGRTRQRRSAPARRGRPRPRARQAGAAPAEVQTSRSRFLPAATGRAPPVPGEPGAGLVQIAQPVLAEVDLRRTAPPAALRPHRGRSRRDTRARRARATRRPDRGGTGWQAGGRSPRGPSDAGGGCLAGWPPHAASDPAGCRRRSGPGWPPPARRTPPACRNLPRRPTPVARGRRSTPWPAPRPSGAARP